MDHFAAPDGAQHGKLLNDLDAALCVMEAAWPDGYAPARAVRDLSERLRSTRFQLAVLGQFKRGKSTFLNALLRSRVLPTAVVPLTAIPTFIAWAEAPLMRIYRRSGSDKAQQFTPSDLQSVHNLLVEYVTEQGNPNNRRNVARVDVFLPAEILRHGVVLIDTPGIGSTLQHNTDAALAILPQCDAAVFVISADPPITEAEIAYLQVIRRQVADLFFVLNKIDYFSDTERLEFDGFVRRTLLDIWSDETEPAVYPISARAALDAALRDDPTGFAASGLADVEHRMINYLAKEKAASLAQSIRHKARRLIDQAKADLDLRLRALEMPIEDLEQRLARFQYALRGIDVERQAAQDLLTGDRNRAVAKLETEADELRRVAREHLAQVAARTIQEHGGAVGDNAYATVGAAIPIFFAAHLETAAARVRHEIAELISSHETRTDALVDAVRRTAADLFGIEFRAAEPAEPFRLGPDPYWVTTPSQETLIPRPETMLIGLLPRRAREARLRRRLNENVEALVQRNVENLRWAILRGIDETFRRFRTQLDERQANARVVTEGAITSALQKRRAQTNLADDELRHWREVSARLDCIATTVFRDLTLC